MAGERLNVPLGEKHETELPDGSRLRVHVFEGDPHEAKKAKKAKKKRPDKRKDPPDIIVIPIGPIAPPPVFSVLAEELVDVVESPDATADLARFNLEVDEEFFVGVGTAMTVYVERVGGGPNLSPIVVSVSLYQGD